MAAFSWAAGVPLQEGAADNNIATEFSSNSFVRRGPVSEHYLDKLNKQFNKADAAKSLEQCLDNCVDWMAHDDYLLSCETSCMGICQSYCERATDDNKKSKCLASCDAGYKQFNVSGSEVFQLYSGSSSLVTQGTFDYFKESFAQLFGAKKQD